MTEAQDPADLLYHPAHDWARVDGGTATFGITWYAQDAVGEIVFVDLPDVGTQMTAGAAYAEIESVKAVSDVIAPLAGVVTEVNAAAIESPELINSDPYRSGWLVRAELADPREASDLLTAAQYGALLADA